MCDRYCYSQTIHLYGVSGQVTSCHATVQMLRLIHWRSSCTIVAQHAGTPAWHLFTHTSLPYVVFSLFIFCFIYSFPSTYMHLLPWSLSTWWIHIPPKDVTYMHDLLACLHTHTTNITAIWSSTLMCLCLPCGPNLIDWWVSEAQLAAHWVSFHSFDISWHSMPSS